MAKVFWTKFILQFKRPSGTSRGVLTTKTSYFLVVKNPSFVYPALGECSLIEGLSPDPSEGYEETLNAVCEHLNGRTVHLPDLTLFPSIQFGVETLMADMKADGSKVLYPSDFTQHNAGMRINGLIWMGDVGYMMNQVKDKVNDGFTCLKLKIGALDFETEIGILKQIRATFGSELELRLDANGAFAPENALQKLERLSQFHIHSIEQPIAPAHPSKESKSAEGWDAMATLCAHSPIAIALDEELIGIHDTATRNLLLKTIKPQFIITKPSLLGGFSSTNEWITLAKENNIDWWMTSALESNVGLNAIAQHTFNLDVTLPQGLGTGGLYTNNLDSPLYLHGQIIRFDGTRKWDLQSLQL